MQFDSTALECVSTCNLNLYIISSQGTNTMYVKNVVLINKTYK